MSILNRCCIDFGSSHTVIVIKTDKIQYIEYNNRKSIPTKVLVVYIDGKYTYYIGNQAETKFETYSRMKRNDFVYINNIKNKFSEGEEIPELTKMDLTIEDVLIGTLKVLYDKYVKGDEYQFVATIPTSYNHETASRFRKILHKAGFKDATLVIESVAGAMSSLDIKNVEEPYFLLDIDGGEKTVDLSLLRIQSDKIIELCHLCVYDDKKKTVAGFNYTFEMVLIIVYCLEQKNFETIEDIISYYDNNGYNGSLTVNGIIKIAEECKISILSKEEQNEKVTLCINKYEVDDCKVQTCFVTVDSKEYIKRVSTLDKHIMNHIESMIRDNWLVIKKTYRCKIMLVGGLFHNVYLKEKVINLLEKMGIHKNQLKFDNISTCVADGALKYDFDLKVEKIKTLTNKFAFKMLDDNDNECMNKLDANQIFIGHPNIIKIYGDDVNDKTRNISFPIYEMTKKDYIKIVEIEFPGYYYKMSYLKNYFENYQATEEDYIKQFEIKVNIIFLENYNIKIQMENNIKYVNFVISPSKKSYEIVVFDVIKKKKKNDDYIKEKENTVIIDLINSKKRKKEIKKSVEKKKKTSDEEFSPVDYETFTTQVTFGEGSNLFIDKEGYEDLLKF